MKILKETLFERIRNRFAPASAVRIIAALQRATRNGHIDYLAVKEASEMVERYKLEAKISIRQWRRWQTRRAIRDMSDALRLQEGRLLLQSARATTSLYLDARRDFLDLVDLALKEVRQAPANQF